MSNIVKLILVCQIKDVWIPQLIPLLWILSNLVLLVILIVAISLYRISNYRSFINKFYKKNFFIYWCW